MGFDPKKQDQYRAANVEAARAILADAERYGGEGAALVEWARRVLAVVEMTQKERGK